MLYFVCGGKVFLEKKLRCFQIFDCSGSTTAKLDSSTVNANWTSENGCTSNVTSVSALLHWVNAFSDSDDQLMVFLSFFLLPLLGGWQLWK